MTTDQISQEYLELCNQGLELIKMFGKDGGGLDFRIEYQKWYSKATRALGALAPDRLAEFRSYYEIDPKRKSLGYGSYVIQDFLKGVVPSRVTHPDFDSTAQVQQAMLNQYTILNGVAERIDSVLADIEGTLRGQLQENELESARLLLKASVRASGTLAGVLLEAHLAHVCVQRGIRTKKRTPSLSDYNDSLKEAAVYPLSTWRKISYLADIRNLCAHKKEQDPTKDQVVELIDGVHWAMKNVY